MIICEALEPLPGIRCPSNYNYSLIDRCFIRKATLLDLKLLSINQVASFFRGCKSNSPGNA